jgi:hypothetical protein
MTDDDHLVCVERVESEDAKPCPPGGARVTILVTQRD